MISLLFSFQGGSGKHRPKEPKKKNKQRLRFRAQNQHSDHLASARSSHWELKTRTTHWTKNQREAASCCCCTHTLTDDYHQPHPIFCLPDVHPAHQDSQISYYNNICPPYDIGINTLNTYFMPLPPAAAPPTHPHPPSARWLCSRRPASCLSLQTFTVDITELISRH